MAEAARSFRAVHLDFGTGDGAFVRRAAKLHPDILHVGVDANGDNLRDVSRRAVKAGLANALFGRLALEDAPGELVAFADTLTVILPWGSLLRAVAAAEPEAVARLRSLCKPDAEVRILFGYGRHADAAAVRDLGLPDPESPTLVAELERRYRAAGMNLVGRAVPEEEVRALPTTWAKKLGFSGKARPFREFRGHPSRPRSPSGPR